ncbi:MAG TPA: efflux RND transporter periplasmic adaptor subunit, partial [Anaerolineae bacterium]|nr:efflux RND transporter periplasmic adaptor subunit [Anaerolineae bacterium]
MKRNRTVFIATGAILLSALGFIGYQRLSAQPAPVSTPTAKSNGNIVSAEGKVAPKSASDLAFRIGGRVIDVLVSEGDQVKQGQPLIRLQDDQLRAGIEQAQAVLDLAKANLAQLEQGARSEEIDIAEAAVRAAQAQLGAATADRDRLTGGATAAAIAAAQARLAAALVDQKLAQDTLDKLPDFVHGTPEEQLRYRVNAANEAAAAARSALADATSGSTQQVKAAQSNVAAAIAQRDMAQARLDQLKHGATRAQIDAAKAGVAQAQAALDAAQVALDEATLKAPFDGMIALINVDSGQVIGPGLVVASIADLNSWEVETDDLSEVDVVNVQMGHTVSITFDAVPGVTLNG